MAAYGTALMEGVGQCEIGLRVGSMNRSRLWEARLCVKVLEFVQVKRIWECEFGFWVNDCRLRLMGWFRECEFRVKFDVFGVGL